MTIWDFDHPDSTALLLGWSAPTWGLERSHLLGYQGLKDQEGCFSRLRGVVLNHCGVVPKVLRVLYPR